MAILEEGSKYPPWVDMGVYRIIVKEVLYEMIEDDWTDEWDQEGFDNLDNPYDF